MAKKEFKPKELLDGRGRPTTHGMEMMQSVVKAAIGGYTLECTGGTADSFKRNMSIWDNDADGSTRLVARFNSRWMADLIDKKSMSMAQKMLWSYVNSQGNIDDLIALRS